MPNGAVIIENELGTYYIKTKLHGMWFYVDTVEGHEYARGLTLSNIPQEHLGFHGSVPLNFLESTAQRIRKLINSEVTC